jgi:hypothetical protein
LGFNFFAMTHSSNGSPTITFDLISF